MCNLKNNVQRLKQLLEEEQQRSHEKRLLEQAIIDQLDAIADKDCLHDGSATLTLILSSRQNQLSTYRSLFQQLNELTNRADPNV